MKTNKQKFSFDTIDNFDDHINKSVSNYDSLIDLIQKISTYFITKNSNVYDLGCSTGLLLKQLHKQNTNNASFVGYDISDNLLKETSSKNLSFYLRDITDDSIKFYNTNFILLIFTLQFLQISQREKLIKKVCDNLNKGGACIVAEKIFIDDGFIEDIFTFTHYDQKLNNFSHEEILKKQIDLRSIMRPLTEEQNIEMFYDAGFSKVQSFYQSLNFKSWILIK
jgi:tRNA (cmo5U34)-methyltransferase